MNYQTKYDVVFEDHAIRLLCFRPSNDHITTLIATPQAGHGWKIAHLKLGQSLTQCTLDNTSGGVYVIDNKGATSSRISEDEVSLQNQLLTAIRETHSNRIHVVGLCQGGWVVALTATNHPELFDEITIAGAPIDTSFDSILSPAGRVWLSVYRGIVRMGSGLIYGSWMQSNWMKGKEKYHEESRKKPEKKEFYEWWDKTQNIAGAWYLWAIDNIFINNRLPEILDIKCHCNVVVGLRDDICPPEQTKAIQMNCDDIVDVYETSGGHLNVFKGKDALKNGGAWSRLFKIVTEKWGKA